VGGLWQQGKVLDTEPRLVALGKKNLMLAIANNTLAAEKKSVMLSG
jgi:hypothetical protein